MARRTLDPAELTVIATKLGGAGHAVFDPYVPLSLEFAPAVAAVANIVIRNKENTALIEIGIDMSTGRLTRATLVMAGAATGERPAAEESLALRQGVPVFSTVRFNDNEIAPAAEMMCPIAVADDGQRLVARWGGSAADTKMLCDEGYVLLAGGKMIGFGADRPADQ